MSTSTTPAPEPSTGELVSRLTEQMSRLVRAEVRLAQVEVAAKGKKLGIGAGLLGAGAIFGGYGLAGVLITSALALALVLPYWLAALIVTAAVLLMAGLLALVGKAAISKGSPPVPAQALESIKQDVVTIQGARHR
ncbi:MAG TPA: phage holin family protein [Mycobacteriales bacterium]|jgi:uncharacterized membrane protein YqjE|nr:phage holin family protein [Mycobacteriales bacterium]